MRDILSIVIIVLWILFGYYLCQHYGTDQTAIEVGEETSSIMVSKDERPLYFDIDNAVPKINDSWSDYRAKFILLARQGYTIEITGMYTKYEMDGADVPDIGMDRANTIASLFSPELDSRSVKLNTGILDETSDQQELIKIRIVHPREKKGSEVVYDEAIFYFPFDSDMIASDVNNESWESIQEDIRSDHRFMLTGHTDAIGAGRYNDILGYRRASRVKHKLINMGIEEDRIITLSKGEKSPIADNQISSGRLKNRRTELKIID